VSDEPSLRKLLAPMAERAVDLEGPEFRVDRRRVLARMAQAKGSDQNRWLRYALAAAASVALSAYGAHQWSRGGGFNSDSSLEVVVSEGSATQVRGEIRAEVVTGRSTQLAAAGDLETAPDSKARVRTVDGLQIELGSQTRVALGELRSSARQVTLVGGSIRCSVPHRASPRAFQVIAPDITVVDLGTVFTVNVDRVNHATTVSVEEGEVVVHSPSGEARVEAPNTWSSASSPAPVPTPPPAATPAAVAPAAPKAALSPGARRAAPPAPAPAKGKAAPRETLDEEARLLRQGLAAERQGRFPDAISGLTTLVVKYPDSPLAPDARAALDRIGARTRR
jgi:hypothetical protein